MSECHTNVFFTERDAPIQFVPDEALSLRTAQQVMEEIKRALAEAFWPRPYRSHCAECAPLPVSPAMAQILDGG